MKIEQANHQGQCDLCKTEVPLDADTCTGCGARWGTSSGQTRQEIYEEGRKALKQCSIITSVLLLFFVVTYYVLKTPWAIVPMGLGALFVPGFFGMLLGGWARISDAKSDKLVIKWWRKR